MAGRLTIGDPGIAAFPGSSLFEEDAMWPANRGCFAIRTPARGQPDCGSGCRKIASASGEWWLR